jgi:hypothetical protein
MIERGLVLGAILTLTLGAGACVGDDSSGGTGGASGSDGGGADVSSGTGGTAEAGPRCGPFADGGGPDSRNLGDAQIPAPTMSFFVTSDKSMTGDLGGLAGADQRCQTLAAAASATAGAKTWHAYLCTSAGDARNRIGAGPWYNSLGALLAADVPSLHMRKGDAAVFIDEKANMINGQWSGSPTQNEHDILTGCNADGTLAVGKTCLDWTSAVGPGDAAVPEGGVPAVARVGHTDGFGGVCSATPNPAQNADVTSWNSAHDNRGCNDTAPAGGAGRLYCFATN